MDQETNIKFQAELHSSSPEIAKLYNKSGDPLCEKRLLLKGNKTALFAEGIIMDEQGHPYCPWY